MNATNVDIAKTLGVLAVIGALWAVFAPNCLGKSFAYPAVFGASVMGFRLGAEHVEGERNSSLGLAWIYGWVGVIYSLPAVAVGWFIGVLICFNVLPKIGIFNCLHCVGVE